MSLPTVQLGARSRVPVALILAAALLTAAFAIVSIVHGPPGAVWELGYDAAFLAAAAACLLRGGARPGERGAWTLIAAGLLFSGLGYLYSSLHWMAGGGDLGYPSLADALWVAQYPLLYAGVVRLTRARRSARAGLAMDGALAALALASLAATLLVPHIERLTGGDTAAIATNVIYPLADLHLFAFVLWTWVLGGRRLGPAWPLLMAVAALAATTDGFYLVQIAGDTYVWGGALDLGWPLVAMGFALAAFLPAGRARPHREREGLLLGIPAVAMLVGIGLLVQAALTHGELVPIVLAAVTLVASVARAVLIAANARRLQAEVERREILLSDAQALANVGSFEHDLRSDAVYWSDELWRVVGLEPRLFTMTPERSLSFVHEEDRPRVQEAIDLGRRHEGEMTMTYRLWRTDGAVRHVQLHGRSADGVLRAAIRDVTAQRDAEDRLRHAAEHDALTGLINRGAFHREVERTFADGGHGAVALLDLDHFKFVNDSFGHAAGDEMLAHAATVLVGALQDGDLLARFGGDEFAVFLRGATDDDAAVRIERMLQALRDQRWRNISRHSASAGLALPTPGHTSVEDLAKAADIALYEAKSGGRDRCAVYRGPHRGLAWVDEVRAAIEEERLVIYSQALLPLQGGVPREELLVRMLNHDGEILMPASFIPTAEQFGLIPDLDTWVVKQAIELARAGRAVEVNVSGATLGDPRIAELVGAAVVDGVDPALLTFELTETAAVRDLAGAQRFARALRAIGCGVALDDFGTGYGALTYLHRLPVTQLKIDASFVTNLLDDPADQRMVRAIVGMAVTLGQETVAEGVEDADLLPLLAEFGVDYAQGYAIKRPGPVTTEGPAVAGPSVTT